MEEFELKLKDIFYYIAEYGIKNKPLDFRNKDTISKEDLSEFKIQVHKGFRIGQNMILDELILLYKERRDITLEEKEANKAHDKEKKVILKYKIKAIDYKISILRHFADFIAWQALRGHHYRARRFFSGDLNRPDLLNTNLESVIAIMEQLHSESEYNFALISDLTTFIDIGDILLIQEKNIAVIECKEGETQSRVNRFLDDIIQDDWEETILKIIEDDTSNGKIKTKKFLDQAMRTVRQLNKGTRVRDFINNDAGTDPFSEKNIEIIEIKKPDVHYYDELMEAIVDARKGGSAYNDIEDVVYYAVFTGDKINYSGEVFKFMCDKFFKNKIITDYISIIKVPMRQPLFYKPFGKETFFDLLFGRLKVYLAIDIDSLLNLLNESGIKAEWMSTKETHKYKEKGGKVFTYNNRAIKVYTKDSFLVLGDTFLTKLLYDNLNPIFSSTTL